MTDECDKDVYENGKVIAVFGDIAKEIVEVWCKLVAKESGQKVDWHYVGGRAVVKAVGDLNKVDKAAFNFYEENAVRYLGGAKSWYGYYPGGENHWSSQE